MALSPNQIEAMLISNNQKTSLEHQFQKNNVGSAVIAITESGLLYHN